jgi:hypothetical protein
MLARICHDGPIQMFLTISMGSTFNWFWRNLREFFVTFSRFANPGKMLEIT